MSTTKGALTNWAGNLNFAARAVHRPRSVEELQELVRTSDRVRALGSGHSFSTVADTTGDLVLLDRLPTRIEISGDTVTVSAATRYAELAAHLHSAGYALGNLASLPHISVAGACATGTHGSGDANPSLAAAVTGLQLMGPDGELSTLTGDRTEGAVVGLGALGIVTSLVLALRPTFGLRQQVYLDLALADYAEHLDEIHACGYSVSLFTDWGSDTGRVWVKQKDGEPLARIPGARPAETPQHPVPGMPPENCTAQLGVPGPWHERLAHFRPEFTPSSGAELQSEFLLPRAAAAEAVAVLRRHGSRLAPLLLISEVRTVAADALWLSPSYGRDSVAFHFTWKPDLDAVTPVLATVERELLALGARPHWGKVSVSPTAEATAHYERLPDFLALRKQLDPAGKFGNAYCDALLGPATG
ncbi:FAD-binding protein [Kitasatospora sp. P5_F3]